MLERNNRHIGLVLLSGGLDSCVAAASVHSTIDELYALSVNYGQVMQRELEHAKKIAPLLGVKEHRILEMRDFKYLSSSSRTHAELIEHDRPEAENVEISAAYPPGRDPAFLFIAAAWVESMMLADVEGITSGHVIMGTNQNDAEDFPDCRLQIYKDLEDILSRSTKISLQYGKRITIDTPLIDLDKAGVLKLGLELGAPVDQTWSCYEGKDVACGRCDPCRLRLWAFEQNGLKDAVPYADNEGADEQPEKILAPV